MYHYTFDDDSHKFDTNVDNDGYYYRENADDAPSFTNLTIDEPEEARMREMQALSCSGGKCVDKRYTVNFLARWKMICDKLMSIKSFADRLNKFEASKTNDVETSVLLFLSTNEIKKPDSLYYIVQNVLENSVAETIDMSDMTRIEGPITRLFCQKRKSVQNRALLKVKKSEKFNIVRLEDGVNGIDELDEFEFEVFGSRAPNREYDEYTTFVRFVHDNTRDNVKLANLHELSKKLLNYNDIFIESFYDDSVRTPSGEILDVAFVPKYDVLSFRKRPSAKSLRALSDDDDNTASRTETKPNAYDAERILHMTMFESDKFHKLTVPENFRYFFKVFPFFKGFRVDAETGSVRTMLDVDKPSMRARLYVYTAAQYVCGTSLETTSLDSLNRAVQMLSEQFEKYTDGHDETLSLAVHSINLIERILTMRLLVSRFAGRQLRSVRLPKINEINAWLQFCPNASATKREILFADTEDVLLANPSAFRLNVDTVSSLVASIAETAVSMHDVHDICSAFYLPDVYADAVYETLPAKYSDNDNYRRKAMYTFLTFLLQNGEDVNHRILRLETSRLVSFDKNDRASGSREGLRKTYSQFLTKRWRRVSFEESVTDERYPDEESGDDIVDRLSFVYLYFCSGKHER
ncbi:hypothetical protein QAD02_001454 [Eretmocerus hayati]|uniref:Uncharacterized protein n=1 Tax=Eretmocerus hayati TaxID=131215 RepID=A0ACC2NG73_9HYME|nr:hypothetical protein QAD02_001454 [Eretmocerus hayati]